MAVDELTASDGLPARLLSDDRDDDGPAPRTAAERLRAHVWKDGVVTEVATARAVEQAYADPETTLWIDLESPTPATLVQLATCLKLHPLIVEDIVERNQRAKVELTGETLHLVMFALLYEGELVTAELDVVLGARFLFTAHGSDWDPHDTPHVRRGVAGVVSKGPDFTLWAIVDWLVDGYFPVFDRLGDEIDQLQDDVIARPSRWLVERLFQVRRDLLTIRHAVMPQREIFNQLTNRDLPLIHESRIVYFRDVYDHLIRLTDELDSFREMVGTTLDAYLSTVNNNLSEIMKRLTAITAILAGIGAAAGIFGMSEASLALGFAEPRFWYVTAFVAAVGAVLFLYFRRIDYI